MRILLVITVVAAVTVLLWASWQTSRKLFLLVLFATIAGLLTLVIGLWHGEQTDRITVAPENVQLAISDINETESGVRLSGDVENRSDLGVARLILVAQALQCPEDTPCTVIHQQEIPLALYIPAGKSYPFAVVSRKPDSNKNVDRWQLQVVEAEAYAP